jgi:hypothetical protein
MSIIFVIFASGSLGVILSLGSRLFFDVPMPIWFTALVCFCVMSFVSIITTKISEEAEKTRNYLERLINTKIDNMNFELKRILENKS